MEHKGQAYIWELLEKALNAAESYIWPKGTFNEFYFRFQIGPLGETAFTDTMMDGTELF